MTGITQHGRDKLSEAVKENEKDIDRANEKLQRLEKRQIWLEKCQACDHPEDQIEVEGGLQLEIVECKKCGYTWYD